jgi:hypothetical protein
MNDDGLRQGLFLLVGYLLTSAHGLFEEPKGYGPFRLVDTAGRLLELMEAHGMADPFLIRLRAAVDGERFGSGGDEQLRAVLNDLCLAYAAELKQRVSNQEQGL